MLDYFRAGLARSAAGLPRRLGLWPYRQLLALLMQKSGIGPQNLWLRNSLVLDYWEFGLSDLDVAVWVDGGASEANEAWRRVSPHRRLLMGGEVQLYSSEWVRRFVAYGNPWELRRDPQLLRRLEYVPSFSNPHHATLFLMRMLKADRGLQRDPVGRQRKWREHLRAMQWPVPAFITWEYLVGELALRAPFQEYSDAELSASLTKTEHTFYNFSALDRLVHANHHVWDQFVKEEDQSCLESFSAQAHEHLACLIEWEVWGVSTLASITSGYEPKSLLGYWYNLRKLIGLLKVDRERSQWLLDGVALLEEFYRPLTDQVQ